MKLFLERMSEIPKDLFGLKIEVLWSRRKTSVLYIVGNVLQIKVPNRVKDRKIIEILQTKEKWIRNKAIQLQSQSLKSERELIRGESFSLFGRDLKLKVLEGGKVRTTLVDDYLVINVRSSEIVNLRKSRIKTYLEKWYIKNNYKRLKEKVIRYS